MNYSYYIGLVYLDVIYSYYIGLVYLDVIYSYYIGLVYLDMINSYSWISLFRYDQFLFIG